MVLRGEARSLGRSGSALCGELDCHEVDDMRMSEGSGPEPNNKGASGHRAGFKGAGGGASQFGLVHPGLSFLSGSCIQEALKGDILKGDI